MKILKKAMIFITSVVCCATFLQFSTLTAIANTSTTAITKSLKENKQDNSSFLSLKEKDLTPYFNYAKKSVETYYLNSMKNENPEKILSSSTNEINDFLKSKLEYETYNMNEFGYTKNYIKGDYELINWEVIDSNFLWCEIAAKITYQYSDSSSISEIGEVIQVVIENPSNPTIIDFYNGSFESFDSQARSHGLDLTNSKNWISNQNKDEIISSKNKCLENHKKAIANQKKNVINLAENWQENTSSANQKLISNYGLTINSLSTRRQNAITYATTNYNKANPASGGQSVTFAGLSPGCTEFISHCLLAGGFNQVVGGNLQENGWYFKSVSNRSSSWAGVMPLFGWLSWSGNTGTGPKASSYVSDTNTQYYYVQNDVIPAVINPGNIIQIKYNYSGGYAYPNYGHSTFVTGYSVVQYAGSLKIITPLITWRTSSSAYGSNVKLGDQYSPAPNTTSGSGGHLYRKINLNY